LRRRRFYQSLEARFRGLLDSSMPTGTPAPGTGSDAGPHSARVAAMLADIRTGSSAYDLWRRYSRGESFATFHMDDAVREALATRYAARGV